MNKLIASVYFFLVPQAAYSELPVSVGIDTKGRYDFTEKIKYVENEIVIEKSFGILKGLTFGLENLAGYQGKGENEINDELVFVMNLGLLDFLSIGTSQETFFTKSEKTSYGVSAIITFGYDFEKPGFSIEDQNEYLYNISEESDEYTNTFSVNQKLFDVNSFNFSFDIENEYIFLEGEHVDSFHCGPSLTYSFFTGYINYALAIYPETAHGIELVFTFEF